MPTATAKPRALLLVHRLPYPPDKGDKIRSWRLLEFLGQHFEVALGCFIDDPADWQHVDFLKEQCAELMVLPLNPKIARLKSLTGLLSGEALTFPYYRSGKLAQWVETQRAKGIVVEFAFSSSMAPYLDGARVPTFIDLVDADSAKWAEYANKAGFPFSGIYAREGRLLAEAEAALSHTAEATFLITPEEADIVRTHPAADSTRIDWYGNGVDTAYFDPSLDYPAVTPAPDIIFTGAMDYQPNAEAVLWFVNEVWPRLKSSHPDLAFAIVGARPLPAVTALGDQPGITVTGRVEDIRPWLAAAKIAIAPLRIARGIQNKVLEAMAMAKPVIASTGAAAGLIAEEGTHLLVRDKPDAILEAVSALIAAPQHRNALGTAARAHVEEDYGWPAQFARLEAHLHKAGLINDPQ